MDQARERELKRIFDAAVDLPPEARLGFLEKECGGDAELVRRLEALLAAAADKSFLIDLTQSGAGFLELLPLAEGPGTIIGRYKLLEKIGEGGFGTVFMAEQEVPVRRRVALKIIKLGMDTRHVVARFEAERQALAIMDHPNIARVLDGGATDSGRPYFVMELIKGISITEYCDKNNLTARERLQLFVPVCRAVQHAHHKGIIHRDIKPGNVLVTLHDGIPVPKVIDFGIAKATGLRLTEKTLFTAHAAFIGTPAYMSPEQAEMSGLDIDTRTDVYSLGVLLYELMTGTTPFVKEHLLNAGYGEIQRIIREVEPPKPSTRVATLGAALTAIAHHRRTDPRSLGLSLNGDLDWIVMRCLEKDRTRRYDTPTGLAEDIGRHLTGEAVIAAPPSLAYRMHKFLRRNRRSVTAASLIVTVLILGIIATTWAMLGQRTQRLRAEASDLKSQGAETLAKANAVAARRAAEEAVEARLAAEQTAYASSIAAAAASIEHGEIWEARGLLNACPTALRNWEWRYLESKLDQSSRVFAGPGGPVVAVTLSPDGSRVVGLTREGHGRLWNAQSGSIVAELEDDVGALYATIDQRFERTSSWPDASTTCVDRRDQTEMRWHWGTGHMQWGFPATLDGKCFALALLDGSVMLRAFATGEATIHFVGHEDLVWQAAFSHDGRRFATASLDRTARVWDAVTGACLAVLRHDSPVLAATLSPDGERVLTVSGDWTPRIWDVSSGSLEGMLSGHKGSVISATFSSDGTRIVTASADQSVRTWSSATLKPIMTLPKEAHGRPLKLARFVRNDTGVLIDFDRSGGLWDPTSSKLSEFEFSKPSSWSGGTCSPTFDRDAKTVVAFDDHGPVRVTSFDSTRQVEDCLLGHNGAVSSAWFSSDARVLVTGSNDGTARLWQIGHAGRADIGLSHMVLASGVETYVYPSAVALSPDGRLIAAAIYYAEGHPGEIALHDARTGSCIRRIPCMPAPDLVSFSKSGTRIVSTHRDDAVARIWDVESGLCIGEFRGHAKAVGAARLDDGETRLLTTSRDNTARIWDVQRAASLMVLDSEGSYIKDAAWSPSGHFVTLMPGDGGQIRICNIRNVGASRRVSFDHRDDHAQAISEDGSCIVIGGRGKKAQVWQVEEASDPVTLDGEIERVYRVRVDRGRILVVSDGDISIWHAATGASLGALIGHRSTPLSLAFSPDGTRILTSAWDGTTRLWDAQTNACLLIFRDEGVMPRSIFTSDGTRIVSYSLHGSIRFRDVPSRPASGN